MRDATKFDAALKAWVGAAERAAEVREIYRVAWAKAYAASDAKTEAGRKAVADEATSLQRSQRDRSEIAAEATKHRLVFERGPEVIASHEDD